MVYAEKLVVALKVGNKFIRDHNNIIDLPFGSEYSIYIKNLNSTKAIVSILIDGKDVLDGDRLIVHPNSSEELFGFKKGMEVENKFRFIEFTKEIEEHIGYSPENSLIEIRYQFEEPYRIISPDWTYITSNEWKDKKTFWENTSTIYDIPRYSGGLSNTGPAVAGDSTNPAVFSASMQPEVSDGITVEGSRTHQDFVYADVSKLEATIHVIVLKLQGYKNNKKVEVASITREKIVCKTCGLNNKYTHTFCSRCGTYLQK